METSLPVAGWTFLRPTLVKLTKLTLGANGALGLEPPENFENVEKLKANQWPLLYKAPQFRLESMLLAYTQSQFDPGHS